MKEDYRTEHDSFGDICVPEEKYWGAQTQRSLEYFSIGSELMPMELIMAYAIVKKASARANFDLGKLDKVKKDLIETVSDEILSSKLDCEFPLYVWQTGSGTQTNMNVNEVIANRANMLAGGSKASKFPVHPNNDVNMSQSSNDTFPTAMHIASYLAVQKKLLPVLKVLTGGFETKSKKFERIIKIGRTHMQDAVPITLGQEFSGYAAQLKNAVSNIEKTTNELLQLPMGGTAVGTGLNAPKGFEKLSVKYIAKFTKVNFIAAENKFCYIASHDNFVFLSGALKTLACSLVKIANDIRLLSSGPKCGIGEILIPENEPGSSIMPGKVNPTQCEALTMVCAQVIGNDAAIAFACSQGNLELNVYKPVIIYNILQSINLLSDSCKNFNKFLVVGIKPNRKKIDYFLNNSLMLVTALNEILGYDTAAKAAKYAYDNNLSLKEACLQLNIVTTEEFEKIVNPSEMVYSKVSRVKL